jgi:hypothetical protein
MNIIDEEELESLLILANDIHTKLITLADKTKTLLSSNIENINKFHKKVLLEMELFSKVLFPFRNFPDHRSKNEF